MKKKLIITSVVSYVLLAVGIIMFVLLGLHDTLANTPIKVGPNTMLNSFNFPYLLMLLVTGGMFDYASVVATFGWIVLVVCVLAVLLLIILKKGYNRRAWLVEYIQIAVGAYVVLSNIFVFYYINLNTFLKDGLNSDSALFIIWIICILAYGIVQVINYFLLVFGYRKEADKVEETPAPVIDSSVVNQPVEEEVKEEVVEEKVEETPEAEKVEEVEEAPEEKVEETPEAEKVEEAEEAPEEKVEETPEAEKVEEVEEAEEETEAEEEKDDTIAVVAPTSSDASKRVKITFEERLAKADPSLIDKYHEIRDEIMSYGIKSRVSSTGDTFRLHTVKYMKIVVAGKKLKLYMKLNPRDYDGTTIPHGDASNKSLYVDIPMVFKVSSDLSVKRAKGLIADMMEKANIAKKKPRKKKEDK